jgi:hypothetical protein
MAVNNECKCVAQFMVTLWYFWELTEINHLDCSRDHRCLVQVSNGSVYKQKCKLFRIERICSLHQRSRC